MVSDKNVLDFYIEQIPHCKTLFKLIFVLNEINVYSLIIKKYYSNSNLLQFVTDNYRLTWNNSHSDFIKKSSEKFILGYINDIEIGFYMDNNKLFFTYPSNSNLHNEIHNEFKTYLTNIIPTSKISIPRLIRNTHGGYNNGTTHIIKRDKYTGYKGDYKSIKNCRFEIKTNIIKTVNQEDLDNINLNSIVPNAWYFSRKYGMFTIKQIIPKMYEIKDDTTAQLHKITGDKIIYIVFYINEDNTINVGKVTKYNSTSYTVRKLKINPSEITDGICKNIINKINSNSLEFEKDKINISKNKLYKEYWLCKCGCNTFGKITKKFDKTFVIQYSDYMIVSANSVEYTDKIRNTILNTRVRFEKNNDFCEGQITKIYKSNIHINCESIYANVSDLSVHPDNVFFKDILLKNGKYFCILNIPDENRFIGIEWNDFFIKEIKKSDIQEMYYKNIFGTQKINRKEYILNQTFCGKDGYIKNTSKQTETSVKQTETSVKQTEGIDFFNLFKLKESENISLSVNSEQFITKEIDNNNFIFERLQKVLYEI